MDFLSENWHLILFGAVALGVLVWESATKKKPTTERMYKLLLLIAATYGIAWTTQEYRRNREQRVDIDFFLSHLTGNASNEFSKAMLTDYRSSLLQFTHQESEAKTEGEVQYQLSIALRSAKRTVCFLDNYPLLWVDGRGVTEGDDLQALKRKVSLTRIFVISDSVLQNKQKLPLILQVFHSQDRLGVHIKYIFQHDLFKYRDYDKYSDIDFALFDDEVLARLQARSSSTDPPKYGVLMWNKDEVRSDNPLDWIAGLGVVHEYPAEEGLLTGTH